MCDGERAYQSLLRELLSAPSRPNRTGIPTQSLFAQTLRFDLTGNDGRRLMPLLTLKRTPFKAVVHELIWFLRGSADTTYLRKHGIKIWDGNTSREYLDSRGLAAYDEGQTGPIYGAQWRGVARRCTDDTDGWLARDVESHSHGQGSQHHHQGRNDQLAETISLLRRDPYTRRAVVSAWNVEALGAMCLPPCHYSYQFWVDHGGRLSCLVNMRSADIALGVPFNIASYALLTHMVSALLGRDGGELVIVMADCHLYADHAAAAEEMAYRRDPRPPATITLPAAETIDDYAWKTGPDDYKLTGYDPHPAIRLAMAV